MPKLAPDALPKYRLHRRSGQAVVTLNGRDHYLGPHGTAASRREYDRLLVEWVAGGRLPLAQSSDLTIVELLATYAEFAREYYQGSGEFQNMLYALKPLKELYGRTAAAEFSPLKIKAVRERMIESGLCRSEVNQRVGRIKRFFAWAVENEHVPPNVLHGLRAVRGLARGRTNAKENDPVRPVPEQFVDALEPHVSPQIWAMISLQRLTGMRPGEVTAMRTRDIDASEEAWVYAPPQHKSAWRGHERKIHLGPQAQEILKNWLRPVLDEPLFQPVEAETWRRQQLHERRKTPLSCGNRPGTNRSAKPRRQPGSRYTARTYYVAIRRACFAAKVPVWSPNQLRHNRATQLRREHGRGEIGAREAWADAAGHGAGA
jgi:integrase